MPKRARIDLRVRTDEKDSWFKSAEKLGLSISELIRRAVQEYVKKPKR